MHNLLGTLVALVILAGGFALTGDLGRVAGRVGRIMQATDVPDVDAPIPVPAEGPHADAVPPPASGAPIPPRPGPDAVDVATLAAGTRIVVWLAAPGSSPHGQAGIVTCDVVDPVAREALVAEAAPASAPGLPAIAPAPPRRALVGGSGAGSTIVRGGPLVIEPRGIAGTGGRETLGHVVGIAVQP